jgi:hypothetical protein
MTINTDRNPVVLIHGISGSKLQTKQAVYQYLISQNPTRVDEDYPLWLNLCLTGKPLDLDEEENSRSSENVNLQNEPLTIGWSPLKYKSSEINPRSLPLAAAPWWKEQMTVNQDGSTVKENAYNRPLQGIDAIWKITPNTEDFKDGRDLRYFAALIEKLRTQGYSDTKEGDTQPNLIAAPYDWRLSAFGLEQKYQYFTNLKKEIENLYEPNKRPVVIIAHSMGNRVTQYFLLWVQNHQPAAGEEWGQTWIDKYIARYIAVSPPWLGAPLSTRFLVSDDPINLSPTTSLSGLKSVIQRLSSVPSLLPIKAAPDEFFNTPHFAFLLESNIAPSTNNPVTAKTVQEILALGGATRTVEYLDGTHYAQNLLIGNVLESQGNKLLERPPVKRLDVIYATGNSTAVGAYYYQDNGTLKVANQYGTSDPVADFQDDKFTVSQGLRFETTNTLQSIDGTKNSGDGVVPYASLAYHKYWKSQPHIQILETNDYPISLNDPDFPGHEEVLKAPTGP